MCRFKNFNSNQNPNTPKQHTSMSAKINEIEATIQSQNAFNAMLSEKLNSLAVAPIQNDWSNKFIMAAAFLMAVSALINLFIRIF